MSSSAAAVRNNYSDLFGSSQLPVIESIFRSELAQHPDLRGQLMNVQTTDRDIAQMTALHDLPLHSEVPENTEYSFERSMQGANKTLTVVKYGLGFSVSEEWVDDGKFTDIAFLVRKLARSGRESQIVQTMNLFNNGFSSETTADGLSIFNSAHTLPRSSTFRNTPSVQQDLSESALQQWITDFRTQFVGDTGIKMNMMPKILLVHTSKEAYARELVGSQLKADTADNNMNSLSTFGLQVISSPHLTDEDASFLLSAPSEHGLKVFVRSPIETKAAGPEVGFMTDSIFYKSRYREVIGAHEAYGAYGSSGSAA